MVTLAVRARVASPRIARAGAGRCAVGRAVTRATSRAMDAAEAARGRAEGEGAVARTARACVAWLARQPANLRDVTPLLRWPNEALFAWGTIRGVVGNACAVLVSMLALTALLGGADALLLTTRAALVGRGVS